MVIAATMDRTLGVQPGACTGEPIGSDG